MLPYSKRIKNTKKLSILGKNHSGRLSNFLQTHIFRKFNHISRTYNQMPLTQLIGRIVSTAIAVLPASQQYRAMQRQKILELQETGDHNSKITLSVEMKTALDC